mgnify:CR=1 FL=1
MPDIAWGAEASRERGSTAGEDETHDTSGGINVEEYTPLEGGLVPDNEEQRLAREARDEELEEARTAGSGRSGSNDGPAAICTSCPLNDEQLASAERESRLREALKFLPLEQLEVIRLSFFQDRPHSEIAEQLKLPLGTVKSRLCLAMARLRGVLGDAS